MSATAMQLPPSARAGPRPHPREIPRPLTSKLQNTRQPAALVPHSSLPTCKRALTQRDRVPSDGVKDRLIRLQVRTENTPSRCDPRLMMWHVQRMFMFVFAAVMGANEPSNGFETNKIYQKNSSAVFVQIRRLLNPWVYNPWVSVTLIYQFSLTFTKILFACLATCLS